jgi:photosystem II stability/assembly factor-like uncharacterized protein
MKKLIICFLALITQVSYSQWEEVPGWTQNNATMGGIVSYHDTIMAGLEGGLLISLNNGSSWDTIKISGNSIRTSLLLYGSLFVGTENGVYLSTDLGETWIPKNNGISNFTVRSIIVNDEKIYIQNYNSGIFYSSDYGESWLKLQTDGLPFSDLDLFLASGNEIWVQSTKSERIGTTDYEYGGLFLTTNLGKDWTPIKLRDDTLQVFDFASRGDSLFVVENNSYLLYLSIDKGNTWQEKKVGMGNIIYSMFLKDTMIFAETLSGLYVSTNSGEKWNFQGNTLPYIFDFTYNGIYFFTIDESGKAIYSSTDFGTNFQTSYQIISYANPSALASSDGIIYAGTTTKLALSSDQGENWEFNENGLIESTIRAIAATGDYIFVGNKLGLFMSPDKGEHWEQCAKDTTLKLPRKTVYSIVIEGNKVVASISDGVLLSTDLGKSWNYRSFAKNNYVVPVALKANTIFAGTLGSGLYISTDLGETWLNKKITDQQISSIALIDSNIFVATNNCIYISTDFGSTWNKSQTWLSYGMLVETWVNSLITDGKNLFLTSHHNGVFISKDLGNTWDSRNSGIKFTGGSMDNSSLAINNDYIFVNLYPNIGNVGNSFYRAKLIDLINGLDIKEEPFPSHISIFPNPARDFINTAAYFGWQYQIYDLLGSCVQSGMVDAENINVAALPTGFYTIRFFKEGKQLVEKLMKE